MTNSILLLGESGSGKTHFGAQLLGRLQGRSGALRMDGAAANLGPFEAAFDRLNSGLAADHTARAAFEDSEWPVIDDTGRAGRLFWPDYGGEQIKDILDQRSMPLTWRARAQHSNGWIVLVRPGSVRRASDIFSRPLAHLKGTKKESTEFRVSEQARLIELLQMLLFARGTGLRQVLDRPRLTILLSCWDELSLEPGARPGAVLQEYLPLLAAFLSANWRSDALNVMGLSALERPLSTSVRDQEYVTMGPEAFGYVVDRDGATDRDLTQPVAKLIA